MEAYVVFLPFIMLFSFGVTFNATTNYQLIFNPTLMSWLGAATWCHLKGGNLITLESVSVVLMIQWYRDNDDTWTENWNNTLWTGLYSFGPGTGYWHGTCSSLDFVNWADNQTYDSSSACSYMDTIDLLWRFDDCENKHSVICQVPNGNCSFDDTNMQIDNTSIPLPPVNASSLNICKSLCSSYLNELNQCWALQYHDRANKCYLYVSVNPQEYLSNVSNTNKNRFYSVRNCFSSSAIKDNEPNVSTSIQSIMLSCLPTPSTDNKNNANGILSATESNVTTISKTTSSVITILETDTTMRLEENTTTNTTFSTAKVSETTTEIQPTTHSIPTMHLETPSTPLATTTKVSETTTEIQPTTHSIPTMHLETPSTQRATTILETITEVQPTIESQTTMPLELETTVEISTSTIANGAKISETIQTTMPPELDTTVEISTPTIPSATTISETTTEIQPTTHSIQTMHIETPSTPRATTISETITEVQPTIESQTTMPLELETTVEISTSTIANGAKISETIQTTMPPELDTTIEISTTTIPSATTISETTTEIQPTTHSIQTMHLGTPSTPPATTISETITEVQPTIESQTIMPLELETTVEISTNTTANGAKISETIQTTMPPELDTTVEISTTTIPSATSISETTTEIQPTKHSIPTMHLGPPSAPRATTILETITEVQPTIESQTIMPLELETTVEISTRTTANGAKISETIQTTMPPELDTPVEISTTTIPSATTISETTTEIQPTTHYIQTMHLETPSTPRATTILETITEVQPTIESQTTMPLELETTVEISTSTIANGAKISETIQTTMPPELDTTVEISTTTIPSATTISETTTEVQPIIHFTTNIQSEQDTTVVISITATTCVTITETTMEVQPTNLFLTTIPNEIDTGTEISTTTIPSVTTDVEQTALVTLFPFTQTTVDVCSFECPCALDLQNLTSKMLQSRLEELKKALYVDKTKTSFYLRKLQSADDKRLSAKVVGSLGIILIVFFMSLIIGTDLISFVQYLERKRNKTKRKKTNKHRCPPSIVEPVEPESKEPNQVEPKEH